MAEQEIVLSILDNIVNWAKRVRSDIKIVLELMEIEPAEANA